MREENSKGDVANYWPPTERISVYWEWVLLHLIKPQPGQSWEKAKRRERVKSSECVCAQILLYIQQLKDCIFVSYLLNSSSCTASKCQYSYTKKYYCPIKTSFCALHVPSVFLVTVTYSSCHEPDRNFLVSKSILFTISSPILLPTHPPTHQNWETPRFSLWANAFPLDRHTEIWERNFNHISTIREVFLCCRGSLFKDSISLPSERDYRTAHLPRRDLPSAKQPAPAKTDLFWGAFKQTIEAC